MSKNKVILAGLGACLVGVVGVVTVYIPHYSDSKIIKERRDEFLKNGNIIDPMNPEAHMRKEGADGSTSKKREKAAGSMTVYQNMDKHAKGGR